MKKRLTLILSLLLAFLLAFSACALPEEEGLPEGDELPIVPMETEEDVSEGPDASQPEETPTETPTEAPTGQPAEQTEETPVVGAKKLDANGVYTSKEDVALYIHTYGKLPKNFITKKAAEALGWSGGKLETYAPGKCIGGSVFGNYEGLLPAKPGRTYWECDIDTLGAKSRGAKRLVYSNDGLIYYTDDHYESFTLLYGEE